MAEPLPEQLRGPDASPPDPGVLDDASGRARLDPSGMLRLAEEFPEQCEAGLAFAGGLTVPAWPAAVRSIVLAGLGGSGIVGDLAVSALAERLTIPITVVKSTRVPGFVDGNTLAFVISYSGGTAETVEAWRRLKDAGALTVSIASGGELIASAKEAGHPHLVVPGGMPPRAAAGFLAMPVLSVLARLGFAPELADDAQRTVTLLRGLRAEWGPDVPAAGNLAKRLAGELYGRLPLIYAAEDGLAAAALRFRYQLNENAKVPAFHNSFPELMHNEVVGWDGLRALSAVTALVVLRDPNADPTCVDATLRQLQGRFASVTQVEARGATQLERSFSLMYLADWTSIYLAMLEGVDPYPIDAISALKDDLAGQRCDGKTR
ncbi:MAG TPA: bifunctional phosphoglucose/phosphomannose isomerase [Coriobacteriia bacterium]|jgi:glucose/mannose-6-phosphate isomerase